MTLLGSRLGSSLSSLKKYQSRPRQWKIRASTPSIHCRPKLLSCVQVRVLLQAGPTMCRGCWPPPCSSRLLTLQTYPSCLLWVPAWSDLSMVLRRSAGAGALRLLALCCVLALRVSAFVLPVQRTRSQLVSWSVPTSEPSSSAAPPAASPSASSATEGGNKPKRLTITEQLKLSPNRWRINGKELEPGVGGIWPGKPDAKTYKVTIRDVKNGVNYTLDVPEDRYIFWAFEDAGIELPMINKHRMCRNGCCTTCALKVREGKTKMEAALGLLRQMRQQNYSLSCCALPRSDIVADLQDEDELDATRMGMLWVDDDQVYIKQWGETFESGGVIWGGFLPDDD